MNAPSKNILRFEYLFLYVVLPISFCFHFAIGIKIGIGLVCFLYLMVKLIQNKVVFFKGAFTLVSKKSIYGMLVNLTVLIIVTIAYLYNSNPEALFNVISTKPKMWLTFIGVYSFLSVIPQEIIYRTFYFHRYESLFPSRTLLLFSNAAVFSLGHIFFNNLLVSAITFVGGIVFALSYQKTKSLLWVSIEHAIYGGWLYTVGFGEILGFPTP